MGAPPAVGEALRGGVPRASRTGAGVGADVPVYAANRGSNVGCEGLRTGRGFLVDREAVDANADADADASAACRLRRLDLGLNLATQLTRRTRLCGTGTIERQVTLLAQQVPLPWGGGGPRGRLIH